MWTEFFFGIYDTLQQQFMRALCAPNITGHPSPSREQRFQGVSTYSKRSSRFDITSHTCLKSCRQDRSGSMCRRYCALLLARDVTLDSPGGGGGSTHKVEARACMHSSAARSSFTCRAARSRWLRRTLYEHVRYNLLLTLAVWYTPHRVAIPEACYHTQRNEDNPSF